MPLATNHPLIRRITIVVLTLAIVGYGLWRSMAFLVGPELIIEEPHNGALIQQALITIKGRARRVSALTLNGQTIYTDAAGRIHESLLLLPGYNILVLHAQDRFGRSRETRLELVRSDTHYAQTP